ncbi:hypothetical protein D3C78_1823230 [compost metagenome]
MLRENRFDYEIIVAERGEPVAYTDLELYFGPLLMQARSEAFLRKWQRRLRLKQRILAHQAAPEEVARHVRWISELLEP